MLTLNQTDFNSGSTLNFCLYWKGQKSSKNSLRTFFLLSDWSNPPHFSQPLRSQDIFLGGVVGMR